MTGQENSQINNTVQNKLTARLGRSNIICKIQTFEQNNILQITQLQIIALRKMKYELLLKY